MRSGAFFLLIAFAALGQDDVVSRSQLTVRARGTAIVTATPDQVRIDVGVITQAQTAEAAGTTNARQVTAVIAELKRVSGAGAEIKTINYSVNPNYRHPQGGGNPTITGYTASNVVQVTCPDIRLAGPIIDAATKSSANTIQGVQFTLKNDQPTRAQALREATQQARANAEALASAIGSKIVRVLRIEDSVPVQVQPVVREMMMARAAAADSVPTPIEPGSVRVSASVFLTAIASDTR